jgi:hypothetical protein
MIARPAKLNVKISKAIKDIGAKPSGVEDLSISSMVYKNLLFDRF